MPRYFAEMMYDGTRYKGWQVQPGQVTVQGAIEQKLAQLFQQEVPIVGSGRTDTGVHARQQYFHFDTPSPVDHATLCFKLNTMLPADIALRQLIPVSDEAHARFDATKRAYVYQVSPVKDAFLDRYAWQFRKPLSIERMNEAAQSLAGRQDFKSFSKVKTEVNHFECTIFQAGWERKNNLIVFNVSANRFLRGMVRALVGTLVEVGINRLSVSDFKAIIKQQDRRSAGVSAPPQGLFLTEVQYPATLLSASTAL